MTDSFVREALSCHCQKLLIWNQAYSVQCCHWSNQFGKVTQQTHILYHNIYIMTYKHESLKNLLLV